MLHLADVDRLVEADQVLYAYCTNDPVNYIDPSGLGFLSFLKKLFKWVAIVVAVIVAVAVIIIAAAFVAAVVFNATLPTFFSSFLGALGTIAGKIGGAMSFMAGAVGVEIGAKTGAYIAATLFFAGVGAINSFRQGKKKRKSVERGSPTEIRITFFRLYGKLYRRCLKKVFKEDYAKLAKQTYSNSAVLDVSETKAQLGAKIDWPSVAALNDPSFGKHGKVFVGRESYHSRTANTRKAIFGSYAHESANILDAKLNPNPTNPDDYQAIYGNPKDEDDPDTGAAVEKCMFGSLQYP